MDYLKPGPVNPRVGDHLFGVERLTVDEENPMASATDLLFCARATCRSSLLEISSETI